MSSHYNPRIILGLMTYGPESCADARVTDLDEFRRHLDAFKTLGNTEIDTARVYMNGEQEKFTSEAGWKERHFQIATKCYPLTPGTHTAANLRKDLETSLADLKTEQVDIFYLHAADRSVPFTETLEAANTLYKEGKFKRLGISNFAAYEVAEIVMLCEARGWVKPTIYQGGYNVIARNLESEVIPACRRYGLDIVVFNPLAGGLLAGKFSTLNRDTDNVEGRYNPGTFLGPIFKSMYFHDSSFNALETIQKAAARHNLTLLEIALRWLVHHSALKTSLQDGNDGVIFGVSKIEQIKQNVEDLRKGPLPADVVEALEKAWLIARANSPPVSHTPLVYTYEGYSKP